MMDAFTADMLEREGKELSDLETEIVEAPFVQVSGITLIGIALYMLGAFCYW